MVRTGKSKITSGILFWDPRYNRYIFTDIRYQQIKNGSCNLSVILVCGRPDRSEYLKVSASCKYYVLYLMSKCVDSDLSELPPYIAHSEIILSNFMCFTY